MREETKTDEEDWVKSAMEDDGVVTQLLLRLKEAVLLPVPASPGKLKWGVRQPRSRQMLDKDGELTRASPTTPLSWSGSASGDGGSNRQINDLVGARSKITGSCEANNGRSRKKKTFPQLKEVESFLLNERTELKKELARLQIYLQKEMNINKSLKRKELSLQLQSAKRVCTSSSVAATETTLSQPLQAEVDHIPTIHSTGDRCQELDVAVRSTSQHSNPRETQKKDVPGQCIFVLPDLNLPLDESPV